MNLFWIGYFKNDFRFKKNKAIHKNLKENTKIMSQWQVAMLFLFCILVIWPTSNIADSSSHLIFDEDSVPSELYPVWLKRLQNLRIKASFTTNNFEMTNSMNMVDPKLNQLFEEFLLLFGRSYHGDATEYNKRYQIFLVRKLFY